MGSKDNKMALAATSKIAGNNLVKSWLPTVNQVRNKQSISEQFFGPKHENEHIAPFKFDYKNFVKIGVPKWYSEHNPEFQFRKGFWKYIFIMPYHTREHETYARYRQTTIVQEKMVVNRVEFIDPYDMTDEELGIPKELSASGDIEEDED